MYHRCAQSSHTHFYTKQKQKYTFKLSVHTSIALFLSHAYSLTHTVCFSLLGFFLFVCCCYISPSQQQQQQQKHILVQNCMLLCVDNEYLPTNK